MDEDKNGLVERILKELNHVLLKPGLTEFDIVPVESNTNKSPVLFLETSVGLESWCVKHVYLHCYTELMDNYIANPKRRCRPSNQNCERLKGLLNATLLLNPDITTLWNKRREMLDKHYFQWMPELQFSRLVLSRKPKCNDAFAYRRWILQDVLKEDVVHPFQFIEFMIIEELSLCNMVADKSPNNYHCWDHRRWLLTTAWNIRFDFDYAAVYFNEYRYIQQWSSSHVSDYSCFHYRQFCLKKLYNIDEQWPLFENIMSVNLQENLQKVIATHIPNDLSVKQSKTFKKTIEDDDLLSLVLGHCPGNCKCHASYSKTSLKLKLLFYELVQNDELLKYYKYHETLWYHRRFIVHEIFVTMYNHLEVERKNGKLVRKDIVPENMNEHRLKLCQNCHDAQVKEHRGKVEKYGIIWVYHCPLFKVLIKHEKEFIKDRRKDSDKYADRHEHYLKYVEGLNSYV